MNAIRLGAAGLDLTAEWSAIIATPALTAALWAAGTWLLGLQPVEAAAFALAATALHLISLAWHHAGHALAARHTGYPMAGVHLWLILGRDVYPSGEPVLPAAVHARRAIGGPVASLILAAASSLLALAVRPTGGVLWWCMAWFWLENLLLLVGSLTPLGFTDGDTLLEWWRKR